MDDALTGVVGQLNVPASAFPTLAPASSVFTTLADFNAQWLNASNIFRQLC